MFSKSIDNKIFYPIFKRWNHNYIQNTYIIDLLYKYKYFYIKSVGILGLLTTPLIFINRKEENENKLSNHIVYSFYTSILCVM